MTTLGKIRGLEILRKYMRRYDFLVRVGNINSVKVLFDEVTDEDQQALLALGWQAIDDYWGFQENNRFRQHFNNWFDKQVKKHELDGYTEEQVIEFEDIALRAMLDGIAVGSSDSKLSESSWEYDNGESNG